MTNFNTTLPHLKARLLATFDAAASIVEDDEQCMERPRPDKWSKLEHVEHLNLSGRGIISTLARDKSFFEPFGAPQHPERTVEELVNGMFSKAVGGVAPAPFDPEAQASIIDEDAVLDQWMGLKEKVGERLVATAWSEADLDSHCLAHPRFGQLTMREMLIFMIFHHEHHIDLMQKDFRIAANN